jgi:hypothetical protein
MLDPAGRQIVVAAVPDLDRRTNTIETWSCVPVGGAADDRITTIAMVNHLAGYAEAASPG